jgi:drug/metabolite transporter (DMT)-like permease
LSQVSRRTAAELALVFNTLVWGATFMLVKSALGGISPLLFLALRFSLATAALALFFHRPLGHKTHSRGAWKGAGVGALVGSFLFLGYLLQTLGLRLTSAPKSAFITGLTSVMVPLLGSFVYRNRPQISEWLGILTATAGLALMTLPGTGLLGTGLPGAGLRGVGWAETAAINRGDVLTFFCCIAFAAHIVTLGHFSRRMGFELLSVTQVGTAALLSLALCGWAETPHLEWRPAVVSGILITGLFATALAFTVQAWAQQYTTHTRTALIYMLEPVVAWATSYLLAGEGLSRRAGAGAALILGGVLLVELKPLSQRQHPSRR